MMRRVSSRPRLVSDADRAFVNANTYTYTSDYDDNNEQDDIMTTTASTTTPYRGWVRSESLVATADPIDDYDRNSSTHSTDDLLDYASCFDNNDNDTADDDTTTLDDLQDLFSEIASLSSSDQPDDGGEKNTKTTTGLLYNIIIPLEDDEDQNKTSSTKRKRLPAASSSQQQQPTTPPRSSYTSHHHHHPSPNNFKMGLQLYKKPLSAQASAAVAPLPSPPSYYSPLAATAITTTTTKQQQQQQLLQLLPEVTLLTIASHLSLHDVRTLATTCHSIRSTLLTSMGATQCIWRKGMEDAFPNVFIAAASAAATEDVAATDNDTTTTNSTTTLIDDYKIPIPGLITNSLDHSTTSKINLPLLTGLMPTRYPRGIDAKTLLLDNIGGGEHLFDNNDDNVGGDVGGGDNVGGGGGGGYFRKFTMNLLQDAIISTTATTPTSTTTKAAATATANQHHHHHHHQAAVSVYQYTGNVGTGDRCIRSDQPFPPNCRKVSLRSSTSYNNSNSSSSGWNSDNSNSGGSSYPYCGDATSSGSFGGIALSWMKNHAPKRRSSRNSNSNGRNNSSNSNRSRSGSNGSNLVASPNRTSLAAGYHHHHNEYNNNTPLVATGPFVPMNIVRQQQQQQQQQGQHHSPLFRFLSSLSHNNCTSPPSSSSSSSRHSSFSSRESNSTSTGGNNNSNNYYYSAAASGGGSSFDSNERAINEGINNYGMFLPPPSHSNNNSNNNNRHHNTHQHYADGLVTKCKECFCKLRHYHNLKSNEYGLRPFVIPTAVSSQGGEGGLVVDVTPRLVAYFEVTIVKQQQQQQQQDSNNNIHQDHQDQQQHHYRHECVAIGLSTQNFNPTNKMPGWDQESYGYHGDDGGIFHGRGGMLRRYGPPFGPGDTIGCGLEYTTHKIFFVKNGVFLGYAFDTGSRSSNSSRREVVERGLYPTVGVDTECPIYVNFGGEMPFVFDLKGFIATGCGTGGGSSSGAGGGSVSTEEGE